MRGADFLYKLEIERVLIEITWIAPNIILLRFESKPFQEKIDESSSR